MKLLLTIFNKLVKNTANRIRLKAYILPSRPQIIIAKALENHKISSSKDIY